MQNTLSTLLPHIEINPASKPIGSVIWLHGLGADGHDFEPIQAEFSTKSLPLRFIFPHAPVRPVTINNGYPMRAWYDIYSMDENQIVDTKGIEESMNAIRQFIAHEETRGLSSEKIILAGFSQGAVIALSTGLSDTKKLGGLIGLSGYLPEPHKIINATQSVNHKTPIFMGHGTSDTIVTYALGKMAFNLLKKNNWQVNLHSYNMAHAVCREEIADLKQWIECLYQSQ